MISLFPISVDFPFTPLEKVEALSLICLRRVGAMDTIRLVLTIKPDVAADYLASGSIMRVKWWADGKMDEFYGYVHTYRPQTDGYLERVVVIGISAAYPMLNESNRVYAQTSIHTVAQDVADDYRFQIRVDPHPLVQDQILQQGDSDWSLLARLAEQWGYLLYLDGAELVFRKHDEVVSEKARTAEPEQILSGVSGKSSRIKEFRPSYSAAGEVPLATTTGQGVDPTNQSTVRWSQSGQGVFRQSSVTSNVVTELEGEMAAIAREAAAKFPFTARATVLYPAKKKPLDSYRISHGERRMTWSIHAVKHIVTGYQYTSEMVLGSDGVDYYNTIGPYALDIPTMIKGGNRRSPSLVLLPGSGPVLGSGGNVVNDDARWRADLVDIPYRRWYR